MRPLPPERSCSSKRRRPWLLTSTRRTGAAFVVIMVDFKDTTEAFAATMAAFRDTMVDFKGTMVDFVATRADFKDTAVAAITVGLGGITCLV